MSNRLAIGGLGAIALAMTASVFLVTDVLLPRGAAAVVTALAAHRVRAGLVRAAALQPYDRWDDDEPSAADGRRRGRDAA